MNVKIQKAMAIIQFKVEAALIDEYPEFGLESRKLLDKIDYEAGAVVVDGVEYPLTDARVPHRGPATTPIALTPAEEEVIVQRLGGRRSPDARNCSVICASSWKWAACTKSATATLHVPCLRAAQRRRQLEGTWTCSATATRAGALYDVHGALCARRLLQP